MRRSWTGLSFVYSKMENESVQENIYIYIRRRTSYYYNIVRPAIRNAEKLRWKFFTNDKKKIVRQLFNFYY